MNDGQTIFTMFYAIFFGVMLGGLSSLKAFPWGWPAAEGSKRKLQLAFRLFSSLLIFNILPFIIFAVGYKLWGKIEGFLNYWIVVLCGLCSLAVFVPYRFHHALISFYHKLYYSDDEWKKISEERVFKKSKIGHFIAVILYLLPLLVVWYFINNGITTSSN